MADRRQRAGGDQGSADSGRLVSDIVELAPTPCASPVRSLVRRPWGRPENSLSAA
jgi:hypothetical protein